MSHTTEIAFDRIAPRCGGQREAFEELCCQLAARQLSSEARYYRLRGAGGDGGVECYADLPDGTRVGWQAKYLFDVDSFLSQAADSLATALRIHPTLTRYILCFPFDLTGPTGRRGRSEVEKFEAWHEEQTRRVKSHGRTLNIESWPATRLRSLLMDLDASGGIRTFFFEETVLSPAWFATHLDTAKKAAGPRYTRELNVGTGLGSWFAAFGRSVEWVCDLERNLKKAKKEYQRLHTVITRTSKDPSWPEWPEVNRDEARSACGRMQEALDATSALKDVHTEEFHSRSVTQIENVLSDLSSLEGTLADALEQKHGSGRADSPGFRQFMAEYMVSFPAANLDTVRDVRDAFRGLHDWLQSPKGSLAFHRAVVLSGGWGVGKTHGICLAPSCGSGNG